VFQKPGKAFKMKLRNRLLVVLLSLCATYGAQAVEGPVFALQDRGHITDWVVLGAFPNTLQTEALPDGSFQTGFYTDFLEPLGGETKAVLKPGMALDYEGKSLEAQAVSGNIQGIVDLDGLFGKPDNVAAYAFCHIQADKAQEVKFLFGCDDSGKVWVNGEKVHSIEAGRALTPGEDQFTAKIKKGLNTVLVKITDMSSDWGFAMEVFNAAGLKKLEQEARVKAEFREFLDSKIIQEGGAPGSYVFAPGKFPTLRWEKPLLTRKIMGKFDLNVRWFDADLNEVTKPEKPGRYAFYAEGTTPSGKQIRRAGTMYCGSSDWMWSRDWPRAELEHNPVMHVDEDTWEQYSEAINDYTGLMLQSTLAREEGAILLSYLDEMEDGNEESLRTNNPVIRNDDFHLAVKRKILGVEDKYKALAMPEEIDSPATVLNKGSAKSAGVKPGTDKALRAVCQEWFEESQEPFIVCIARHGVVILHEAFGEGPHGKVTKNTATEMASLTKLVTGVMFAQFMEQGLVDLDDPIGMYLPDFPTEGEKTITVRHLFTHTTGLEGHAEYGGLHNPWMENAIANDLDNLPVSKVHIYNGMGYDLAGRVMEMVSGKSIFRLMRENFFDPLGLEDTTLDGDLGFSTRGTAGDFAVIGQLVLNQGSYGDLRFFSPETFDKLLPKPLQQWFPEINLEWGIGFTWMREGHPDSGKDGNPNDMTVLGKKVVGHGSATSAVLRVDLDNDLVIAQTRRTAGNAYGPYLKKMLMALEDGLVD
jgi:CubicO group peptidase (beta-lactamase class C family)